MKKFIGNVNGVEYTNREDFNEAVKKAIENTNETLVVTSYETDIENVDVNQEKRQPIGKVKMHVFDEDLVSGISTKNEKTTDDGTSIVYEIPDGLVKKLENCENVEETIANIKQHLSYWKKEEKTAEKYVSENKLRIEKLNEEIKAENEGLIKMKKYHKQTSGATRYYETLLSHIGKNTSEYIQPSVKTYGDSSNVFESFGSFLKRNGFF